ncbi:alkene reductase [Nocardia abscessus]|uniref:alkene reductase n=1 Tax=Nocardia abscessus TaxID=120957 RepID=UPI0003113698|nr:alkene reductase [Nocardia abscessus]MCC3332194.1 alkene reductase [Nocardia abscessus]
MVTAFDSIRVGSRFLRNRIVMAPMTRNRAYGPGATPTAAMATYYAQRASAGLIITEGVQPSAVGQGTPNTPGLHTEEQVAAWRTVTDAVHERGGVIFAQLMHAGRISHPSILPPGSAPVGPSAVRAAGQVFAGGRMRDTVTPVQLTEPEILQTVQDFATAGRNAVDAGFDGVEVHGGNGQLLHQFLAPNSNRRTDGWGGSVAGRIRMTIEVATAIANAIGANRVGLRISPTNPNNDIVEVDPEETYEKLVEAVNPLGLAYLHVSDRGDPALTSLLRASFRGPFLLNPWTPGRSTGPDDLGLIEDGSADLLSFGALFLANPDLPARLEVGGPLNTPDRATYYGGDEHGYTDYPALASGDIASSSGSSPHAKRGQPTRELRTGCDGQHGNGADSTVRETGEVGSTRL